MTQRITNQTVNNPQMLRKLLEAFDVEMDAVRTLANQAKSLVNDIRSNLQEDLVLNPTTLATGTTNTNVASIAFDFGINGIVYKKAAVAAGTALSGNNVPQNKYGAWRLEIGINGTIDIVEAEDNANGYNTAALATAALPALSANHANMGIVTAMNNAGIIQPGTTALDHANVTEAYTDGPTMFAAIAAAVSASDITEQVEHGS